MQIVLPQEATGRKIEFYQFVHPRTSRSAKFLVDLAADAPHKLYELTLVGNDMRSSILSDELHSNGSIVVATPLHPLFMVIPTLYKNRNKAYSLEIVLELAAAADNCQELPQSMVEHCIASICDLSDGKVMLNMEKLKEYLDIRAARVRAGLPQSIKEEVLQSVVMNEQSNPTLLSIAEQYGAVSMLSTSWLSDEVADWYIGTCDFTRLTDAAHQLEEQHRVMDYMQDEQVKPAGGIKRPSEPAVKKAKQPKLIKADNNRSILDMFKRA